ncbi:hypothetical protein [uncultured Sulfitobacter sp.]|nr:hypothetical protein [uncultured Sulfitobacter sp.]
MQLFQNVSQIVAKLPLANLAEMGHKWVKAMTLHTLGRRERKVPPDQALI